MECVCRGKGYLYEVELRVKMRINGEIEAMRVDEKRWGGVE